MNRSIRLLSALAIGAAAFATPQLAHAENFSLHLEPGMAQPLNAPQDNIYTTGMVLGAKGMFNLKPWLSVGPSVSAVYLPRIIDDGSNAGVLWQFGGSARLQRDRTLFRLGIDGDWSPWIDVDLTAAHTGQLWRPALDLGVGLETALDHNHAAWWGPFIRYTHVFQTSDRQDFTLLDDHDVSIFQAGISFSFDFPSRARTVVQTVHSKDVEVRLVPMLKTECPKCAGAVAQAAPLELKEKVYFDWDKSTLRWESKDKLDAVVAKLQAHPGARIHVQGHASSDGQKVHNEKLAGARAEAVRQDLVSHGVVASSLTVDNFGVDRPAGDQKKQEGRERSRRVEFEITVTAQ